MFDNLLDWILRKLTRAADVYVESLPSMASNLGWFVVVVSAALAIELMAIGWQSSSLKKILKFSGSIRNDLFAIFLNVSSIGNYIAILMSFGLFYVALKALRQYFGPDPMLHIDNLWLAVIAFVVLSDFMMYWFHRLAHRWQAFWDVHAYHHSADEMTVISGSREHPLFFPLSAFWLLVPMVLIARRPEVGGLFVFLFATRLHGLLIHSNITSDWGWFGRWVVVSPAMHRMHHGQADAFHNTNFGSLLTLWDRIFGTWKGSSGIDIAAIKVGLADIPGGMAPWPYLMSTYTRFVRSLINAVRALVGRRLPTPSPSSTPSP
jgi:sterol desaturase/sphingolipid hydroxylase (fatty acid hydroxylase superfamily)